MCNECVQPVFRKCPYCDNDEGYMTIIESYHVEYGRDRKGCQVQCTKCSTAGPWKWEVADAIRAWNELPRKPTYVFVQKGVD